MSGNFPRARTAGKGLWAGLEAGHGLGEPGRAPFSSHTGTAAGRTPRGSGGAAEGPGRSSGAGKRGESRAQPVHRPSPPRGSARAAAAACAVQSQAASRNRAAASPPLSESEPVSLSGPEPPMGAAILQARDTLGVVVLPRCMPGAVVRLLGMLGAVVPRIRI